ncbi:hypothetical protein BDV26DRAFT_171702 [Aspergillus bertholletiae]|uniref:SWIM-type domain-containing protein n=1 Tax=Aspergillus bertholletiae TaxID=1226010 RepID=A0A5N7BBZ1_9EURO|nr:hypothetical protein BDV26DRAFT_171702 [Aspergillus bertholletiae]
MAACARTNFGGRSAEWMPLLAVIPTACLELSWSKGTRTNPWFAVNHKYRAGCCVHLIPRLQTSFLRALIQGWIIRIYLYPMSAPTRQLHGLSIGGEMLQRPTQPEGTPRPKDNSAPMETGSDESEAGGELSGFSTLQGKSGITYDLTKLDPESEARALVGLTSRFDVIGCRKAKTGFDFLFSERPRVHIGSGGYTCTCSAFTGLPGVACPHVFWLVDQLHGCLIPQIPNYDVPLSSDGHPPAFARIERLLDGKLETVAEQLSWQYVRSEVEGGMTRQQKVRDLMSAFDTVVLPEDFRLDLIDDIGQPRTPEQCVVQGDFEATMFRLAVHDDTVYFSLCKAMPPGACAAIYFDKVQERSRKLLADFDRYCQTGRRSEGSNVDVDNVIGELQHNVNRIQANIITRAPHGVEGAAKALVTLLEDICNRNKDALDGNRWGGVTFHGEDEDQRNLYHQLIGKVEETGECFILDALEQLSGSDLHQFKEKLRAILQKNEVTRAPKAYILKLNALVHRAESNASSSGQKRPATASSGGHGQSKRTR